MCKQETIRGIDNGKLVVLPKWTGYFRIVSPLAWITLAFYVGVEITDIKSKIFNSSAEKEHVLHVVNDETVHMSYERKIEVFVPRTEVEYKLDDINKKLDKLIELK